MKVTYRNAVFSIDITQAFVNLVGTQSPLHPQPSDLIVISGDPVIRSVCFNVPRLPETPATVIVEDDRGKTKFFEEGQWAVLRKIAKDLKTYELVEDVVDVDDRGSVDAVDDAGMRLLVDRVVQPDHRVLEIGGDDGGAVPAAILSKTASLLCFRSDQEKARRAAESCPAAVEGAILSSVPLVKNVDMLKEPAPGIDDDETWKPVRTMGLAELAEAHPGFDRPNVLILGCNHDKYRPLILEEPTNDIVVANADLKVIVIKNDFLPPTYLEAMHSTLRKQGFEIAFTVGACDGRVDKYMPNMYEAWERPQKTTHT
jgi:hypothetical protein